MGNAGADLESERKRYRKKITEWSRLGFSTQGLEELLDTDFDAFLVRKSQILLGQVKGGGEEKEQDQAAAIEKEEDVPVSSPVVKPETSTSAPEEEKRNEGVAEILIDVPKVEDNPAEDEPFEEEEPEMADEGQPVSEGHALVPTGAILLGKPLAPKVDKIDLKETGEVMERPRPKLAKKPTSAEPAEIELGEKGEPKRPVRKMAASRDDEDGRDEEEDEERTRDVGLADDEGSGINFPDFKKIDFQKYMTRRNGIIALIIVIILITAGYVYANRDDSPVEPDDPPKLTADIVPDSSYSIIQEGDKVGMAAEVIEKDLVDKYDLTLIYQWSFSDSDFKVTEGSSTSRHITGYFLHHGFTTFQVVISYIWTEDAGTYPSQPAIRTFEVDRKTVYVIPEKMGDITRYDTNGSFELSNIDMTFEGFTVNNIDLDFTTKMGDLSNPPDSAVSTYNSNAGKMYDGLGIEHNVFMRTNRMNLALVGKASTQSTESGVDPVFDIAGNLLVDSSDYICRYDGKSIYSLVDSDFDMSLTGGADMTFYSWDRLGTFSDLTLEPIAFSIYNLSETNSFSTGDDGDKWFGSTMYSWEAEDVEVLNSTHNPWRPTVRLKIKIDSRTMHNNNLKTFVMKFWLDNNLPIPVKTYLHMVRENDDGSVIDLEMYQEMTSFGKGTESIVYNKAEYKPDDFLRYDAVDDSYSSEFVANWSYQPPLGSMDSSISSYFADAAITKLKTNDATKDTWSDYISTRTNPFMITGNVTSSGELNWAFTFGEYAYLGILNAKVSEDGTPSASKDSLDDSPGANPKDIEEILSFSGAENILLDNWAKMGRDNAEFYTEYEIFDLACEDIFKDDNSMEMAQYQFGVDTQVIVPSLDFTSTSTLPQVDYGFIITQNPTTTQINSENEDNIYTVAINAETGQIIYVWEHREEQTGLGSTGGIWWI